MSKSAQVRKLLGGGLSASDIAKKVGCTLGLVYNVKSRMGSTSKRGPGRQPKAAHATATEGLDGIIAAVQSNERERVRLQGALQRIAALVAEVLR